jgi:hypothetical protein
VFIQHRQQHQAAEVIAVKPTMDGVTIVLELSVCYVNLSIHSFILAEFIYFRKFSNGLKSQLYYLPEPHLNPIKPIHSAVSKADG